MISTRICSGKLLDGVVPVLNTHASSGGIMARTTKCAYQLCTCEVTGDGPWGKYCSPLCEEAGDGDVTELLCDCKHPGCQGTIARLDESSTATA
jgi:hypothetical protein